MGVERIRLSPPQVGLGPESEKASLVVTARRRPALGSRPSPAVRQHPGKLARRLQGEAAAGAWGVATPGELRGCAECEPGARVTDVAWAGAAPVLAKRGARFGAPSARLSEVPFASPSRERETRGYPRLQGTRRGLPDPGGRKKFLDGARRGRAEKGAKKETRSPKCVNLGKGGKKVGEETETKKKKKRRRDEESRRSGEKERLLGEQDSGNVDEKDGKREEPSGNGEEG